MRTITRALKDLGYTVVKQKENNLTLFTKQLTSEIEMVLLVFSIKRGFVSIDMGIRFNRIEEFLERYEKEQMLIAGFPPFPLPKRPTFYRKVYEGILKDFDFEMYKDENINYFSGSFFGNSVVSQLKKCLLNYECPCDFPRGGSVYLAKRALIHSHFLGIDIDRVISEMADKLEGVKAYLEDIEMLSKWLKNQ